jgi:hypothetical protein
MNIQPYARLLMIGGLVGSLACARSTAEEDVSPRRDTTTVTTDTAVTDTAMVGADTTGQQQNPPGYQGMERDTTVFPYDTTAGQDQEVMQDTLDPSAGQQGQGIEQDTTQGYQGMGQDTLNQGMGQDTLNQGMGQDTLNQGMGQDTLNQGGVGQDSLQGYQQYPSEGQDTSAAGVGTDTLQMHGDSAHVGGDTSSTQRDTSWSGTSTPQ